MRRVVITGLGAVTPVGTGVKAFWHALREGTPGVGPITLFDATAFACRVAAEIRDFEPRDFMPPKTAATIGRFARFGVAAARMAFEDAGLDGARHAARFAVCFGSSSNAAAEIQQGVEDFSRLGGRGISPALILESAGHAVTGHVSAELGLVGQTITVASGCSAGVDVVGWAYDQVRTGRLVGVLAGATDAPLTTYTHAAFSALGVLSEWPGPPAQALRP